MNSHFSLVLITCRSSENSSQSQAFSLFSTFLEPQWCEQATGQCTLPEVLWWTLYQSCATTEELLSTWWASCQDAGSGKHTSQPTTNPTRNHQAWDSCTHDWKSISCITEMAFWSCERCFLFMEKDEIIICSKHLLNKLCSLSCPEIPRKWTSYALLDDQIAIKCFVYIKSQAISHFHQMHALSYQLSNVPTYINNKENIFLLLEGI